MTDLMVNGKKFFVSISKYSKAELQGFGFYKKIRLWVINEFMCKDFGKKELLMKWYRSISD